MAQTYYIFILLVSAAVCLTSVKATIDCNSREERADAYEQCFNDQGLQAPDVFESYRTSDNDLDELPVEDMFMKHGDSFCTNHTTELKAAVRCSYQVDINCTTDPFERSLMPSAEDMAKTMDPICENLEHLNFQCTKQREPAVGDCGLKRVNELQTITNLNEIICLSHSITAECVKKEYKPCGCTSAKVYSDFTMDLLMPNSCDQTMARVVCSATNPNEFVDDGLGGVPRQGMTIGLLAVSVLVVAVLV